MAGKGRRHYGTYLIPKAPFLAFAFSSITITTMTINVIYFSLFSSADTFFASGFLLYNLHIVHIFLSLAYSQMPCLFPMGSLI